jgi:hypothetical protein
MTAGERAQFEAELAQDPAKHARAERYAKFVAGLREELAATEAPPGLADAVLARLHAAPAGRNWRPLQASLAAAAILLLALFVTWQATRSLPQQTPVAQNPEQVAALEEEAKEAAGEALFLDKDRDFGAATGTERGIVIQPEARKAPQTEAPPVADQRLGAQSDDQALVLRLVPAEPPPAEGGDAISGAIRRLAGAGEKSAEKRAEAEAKGQELQPRNEAAAKSLESRRDAPPPMLDEVAKHRYAAVPELATDAAVTIEELGTELVEQLRRVAPVTPGGPATGGPAPTQPARRADDAERGRAQQQAGGRVGEAAPPRSNATPPAERWFRVQGPAPELERFIAQVGRTAPVLGYRLEVGRQQIEFRTRDGQWKPPAEYARPQAQTRVPAGGAGADAGTPPIVEIFVVLRPAPK